MAEKPKYYITTPIYYVNARPHLGHTYTTIAADVIARYKQMRGYDVVLLTGTDEHGQKVERSAKKEGVAPQDFADRISSEYRALWKDLDLRVDRFIRTTELRHARAVQKLFREVQRNGYVEKGYYEGNYCVYDELYVDDTTPGANCPDCGRPTERVKEENYFFKLSAFEKRLLNYYEKHPEFVQPDSRRNEVISFVSGGLRDLSISRTTLKWGIPWPGDEKHVFYVWSDALTNYITAIGYADDPAEFERLWPADVHLVGKEIIRFHAVYWPAFLMAAGLPLPKQVFAHGHILFHDVKMSKSRGNIQSAQPIAQVLGTDALRYFLMREIVFGQDGSFSREALIGRYNSDLANGLGNLVSRTLTMIEKYFEGEVPAEAIAGGTGNDAAVKTACTSAIREACELYEQFAFSRALEKVWQAVSEVDRYLTAEKPWDRAENAGERAQVGHVLATSAAALGIVAVLAHPVLPKAAQKIWELLGQRGQVGDQRMDEMAWSYLPAGTRVGKADAIFPRAEKAEAIERMEAMEHELQQPKAAAAASAGGGTTPAPASPERIAIEDFTKVEMRVGEIKTAERVQGADKLLKVTVDIGSEVRQVVAGIAQHYEPEKLIGRKVIVVVNLQPRKLRGVESNGMIVAASVGPEGRPVLAGFHEEVEIGARLK